MSMGNLVAYLQSGGLARTREESLKACAPQPSIEARISWR